MSPPKAKLPRARRARAGPPEPGKGEIPRNFPIRLAPVSIASLKPLAYSSAEFPDRKSLPMSSKALQTLSFVVLCALTLYVAFGGGH